MSDTDRLRYSRRRFIHLCSAVTALASCRVDEQPLANFNRVQLVDADGKPFAINRLEAEREYVFFYPYVCTPCFLLNLGKPTQVVDLKTAAGKHYRWAGGVGPQGAIVAFAAICSHKLTHPSQPVSFIGYRQQPVGFLTKNNVVERRAAVIQCCSEHSIYDPAQGAKVLAGPAPQPLASIALEEQGGVLHAVGVYGGSVYQRFFERFGFRLELEFGQRAREPVEGSAAVIPIEQYTRQRIQC
jgi:Rieske Fe-S protein